ncbi:MAG: YeeE/YedE family protein [Deltaproteobacteria bacterium]|nr:YeeE/YedE family protein [Candidatus Anaeroferrophillacea bacterium]
MELGFGLATGIVFGFLLQRGQVLRFEKQVGFLLLRDLTIIKFMLSAIVVGMVGLHLCRDLGIISFSLKGTVIGAQVIGGLLFGSGWAVLGFCPGTSVGAVAEGRWHAIWGILGMIAGAAVYAEVYPAMKKTILTWGNYGKVTFADVLHVNHWLLVAVFSAVILGILFLFERSGR